MGAEGASVKHAKLSGKRTKITHYGKVYTLPYGFSFFDVPCFAARFFVFNAASSTPVSHISKGDKMQKIIEIITGVNNFLNSAVWGLPGLILLIGTGILLTVTTKFFQLRRFGHWWKNSIGSIFKKNSSSTKSNDKKSISQFQALCAALAATIGTGNIAGVAAAIVTGGPGAVFWMWIAAFFGMMTSFAENVLGIYYRRKNSDGEWCGGPMYYLHNGLGEHYGKRWLKPVSKILAVLFALFAILASFGIGNMAQINKIVLNMDAAFFSEASLGTVPGTDIDIIRLIIGLVLLIIGALIILGGLKVIAKVSEIVVPFMAIAYLIGCTVIICINCGQLGTVFASIFKYAFHPTAVLGGTLGVLIQKTMTQGFKRGIFSNEAGLGSSVMVHSSSNVKEPIKQGMWGIFQVFFDTIVVCTITAIVVLSSGFINLSTGEPYPEANGDTLVSMAFGKQFGTPGTWFIAIAILFFAFTTVLGWSQYGSKAVEYLFGRRGVTVYKIIFVIMIVSGAVMEGGLAWELSDTFNGLMMIPNLIGVVALFPLVLKITKNYTDRKIKGLDIPPMYSYDEDIQRETEDMPDED